MAAGVLGSTDSVDKYFSARFAATFDELAPVVDEDNRVFEAAEAAEGSRKTSRKPAAKAAETPGETVFFGGKFKGCTIQEVYGMDEATAKEGYDHQYGDGSTYITNYVATDKNTNATTREAARAYLASLSEA